MDRRLTRLFLRTSGLDEQVWIAGGTTLLLKWIESATTVEQLEWRECRMRECSLKFVRDVSFPTSSETSRMDRRLTDEVGKLTSRTNFREHSRIRHSRHNSAASWEVDHSRAFTEPPAVGERFDKDCDRQLELLDRRRRLDPLEQESESRSKKPCRTVPPSSIRRKVAALPPSPKVQTVSPSQRIT
jgi:hypothetical protein